LEIYATLRLVTVERRARDAVGWGTFSVLPFDKKDGQGEKYGSLAQEFFAHRAGSCDFVFRGSERSGCGKHSRLANVSVTRLPFLCCRSTTKTFFIGDTRKK
jgi:hypothetical protein